MATLAETHLATEGREQAVADAIMQYRTYAGKEFQVGDFVAILGDTVVAVGRSYDAVAAALAEREPRRDRGMICLVSDAPPDVLR